MPNVTTSYGRFSGFGSLEISMFDMLSSSNFHKCCGKFMKIISSYHLAICNYMLRMCVEHKGQTYVSIYGYISLVFYIPLVKTTNFGL